jgi:hypothetical protein
MRALASAVLLLGVVALAGCSSSSEGADTGSGTDDVVTRKCPENLSASFSGLDAFSFAEIEQREGFVLNQSDRDELRAPLRRIETLHWYKANLKLKSKGNAECHYESATPNKPVTAKFYTTNGKNILRIDAEDRWAKDLSFYLTLDSYTKESVSLAYPNAGIFFRAPDSEAAFRPRDVGRAARASLKVTAPTNVAPNDPAGLLSDDQLVTEMKSAVNDILYISEADYPFDVWKAPLAASEAVTPDTVKAKFSGQPGTDEDGVALKDLVGKDESDFEAWFASDLVDDPSLDEDGQKYAKAMRRTYALMKANCTDLKIVLAAGSDLSGSHDVGFVQIFIVGRTRNGSMIAMHTGAVWT